VNLLALGQPVRTDLHVFHVRSSAGLYGAEYVILGLVPALERLGIGSTLLCLDNQYLELQPLHAKARALGLPAVRIPCRGRFDLATIGALRSALAKQPNALLHVHDYKSALNAWIARGRGRMPIVATGHGQFSSTARLHLYHRLELSLMRRFERVCMVSAEMRPLLATAGVRDNAIRLIENGIDTDRFSPGVVAFPRAEFGIADNAVVFGSAMRLTAQKNVPGLIDAFAQLAREVAEAVLVIAGEGELRDAANARAAALGIADRVRLIGAREEMPRFYAMLDVFVLPSLYEGLPLALLEAMSMARRVVATRTGQVADVLDGLPAELVAAGDPVALAEAMRSAMSNPVDTARLRERVVQRYSLARMADAYAGVYRDVWREHERAAA
jgi:glycosyltransferase involved in cell wall biosynthesis